MSTYNTPYKSGTITSISGDVTTVAGFTPAASDIGRILIVTNGAGKLQHREIIARSGQDLTLRHTWDTNPYIDTSPDARATDVVPADGDAVVVSYLVNSSFISADGNMSTLNNSADRDLTLSGTLTVYGDAYLLFKDYNVDCNFNNIRVGRGGGLIFGYYRPIDGEDAYETDSCTLTQNGAGTGATTGRRGGNDYGMIDMYGGTMRMRGSPFLRLYEDTVNTTDNQTRIMNVQVFGSLGGRLDGNRSMALLTNEGSTSTTGVFNFRAAVARIEMSVYQSSQAGYLWLSPLGGASGRTVFTRLANISTRLLRVATGGGAGEVYEIIAKKDEVDLIPQFAVVSGSSPSHTMRYGNLVKPSFIDDSSGIIATDIKTRLYDDTSTHINEEVVTGGTYTELFVRHTDIASSSGNRTLANGTQYAPYSLRSITYGKQFVVSVIDAEDTFNPKIVMLDDLGITESSQAVVDAYTGLETTLKIYDRSVSWLQSNITDETALPFIRSGAQLDAGSADVDFDSTAVSVFDILAGVITVKTGLLTGGVDSTGLVRFINGVVPSSGSFSGNVSLESIVDLVDIEINGSLTFTQAGTYSLTGCTVNEVINTSGGSVVINVLGGTSITLNSGPDITIVDAVNISITATDDNNVAIKNATALVLAGETVGTITTGDQILLGQTDAAGNITLTGFAYEGAFNPLGLLVEITVRQGSIPPVKETSTTTARVVASTGLSTTVVLQDDE